MTFVKSHSKFENGSTCGKDGCENRIEHKAEYIYDTVARKGYCLKHDEVNSKVEQRQGGGGRGMYKLPMDEAVNVLELALELTDVVLKKIDTTVTGGEQLQLVESMYKTLSQSYKKEGSD